jgi:hypothetical protein
MAFTRSGVRLPLAPPPACADASAGKAFAGQVSAEALEKADNLRQHSKDNQPLWLPSDGSS